MSNPIRCFDVGYVDVISGSGVRAELLARPQISDVARGWNVKLIEINLREVLPGSYERISTDPRQSPQFICGPKGSGSVRVWSGSHPESFVFSLDSRTRELPEMCLTMLD